MTVFWWNSKGKILRELCKEAHTRPFWKYEQNSFIYGFIFLKMRFDAFVRLLDNLLYIDIVSTDIRRNNLFNNSILKNTSIFY